ncbi:MAG TPA: FixH family protein [Alphaproteobacteria bacterium]
MKSVIPTVPCNAGGRTARDRWIPWVFVAGMLTVVVANACLIYFASSSWSGLVVAHPYERGIGYNRVLAAAAAQEALGWQLDLAYRAGATPLTGEFVLRALDRTGRPLRGLDVTVELTRPVEAAAPMHVTLRPAGEATYTAAFEWPRAGQWQARIRAERGSDSAIVTRRLFVR